VARPSCATSPSASGSRAGAEGERRLAAIIEQTSVGVAQTDLDGRFELVNPRLCQIARRGRSRWRRCAWRSPAQQTMTDTRILMVEDECASR
jgi:PAS domain-containing protein